MSRRVMVLAGVSAVALLAWAIAAGSARAAETVVTMHAVSGEGIGAPIGTLTLKDTRKGLRIVPRLDGLPPGSRGFHVHVNPTCAPAEQNGQMVAALAAGGHYDPESTSTHSGPHGDGHKGDLPPLKVGADGRATEAVVAPRLTLAEIKGRSIVIHEGGDNFADEPKPLGGGGPRIACGVVE